MLLPSEQYTASLECIYALRHRAEVLVSHSGSGQMLLLGECLYFHHMGDVHPVCEDDRARYLKFFFVSVSSYRNLLSSGKKNQD